MKTYPSIPYYTDHLGKPCIAFVKYDGSNLRFEWNKKKGWNKYGTRRHLFDRYDPIYGSAVDLFERHLAEPLEKVFYDKKDYKGIDQITVFAEFFGPNSFAGDHEPEDPKELILFDVNPLKKGIVSPRDFVRHFGHIPCTAQVLYEGVLNNEFVQSVINNELPVQEGVVAKGGQGHQLWMAKIKTAAWVQSIKTKFPREWREYHDQAE
jgi:hypothetical protein